MTDALLNLTPLSYSDERILNSVFDPENSPDTPTIKIDESLPSDPHITDPELLKRLRVRELGAIRLVEEFAITTSSQPNSLLLDSSRSDICTSINSRDNTKQAAYAKSLEILSTLITEHPEYASAYNNRAQLRRWRYEERLLKDENAETSQALAAVLEDLDTAIKVASPTGTNSAVSPAQSKLLSQAWTQRGAVLWALSKRPAPQEDPVNRDGNPKTKATSSNEQGNVGWRTWDAMRLEEEGSRSFFMAGMYGSEIGRTMAVKTNPYARLCAGIVKEAMKSEFGV